MKNWKNAVTRRVVNQNIQKGKFTVVLFLESKFDVGMLRVDEFEERHSILLIVKNAKGIVDITPDRVKCRSALSKLLSQVSSWKPRKRFAKIGAKGDPIATPSTWSYNLPLKRKWVSDVANENNFLRSVFLMENLGFCLKMRSTAMSIVSFNGMLVKRLSTSKEIRNLLLKSKLLSSSTKEKESLTEYLSGKSGTRRELKYLAKL